VNRCFLQPVDWSEWGGLWLPCAGSVTPWGTHLGRRASKVALSPILPSLAAAQIHSSDAVHDASVDLPPCVLRV
jgi:hypothetical protein